MDAVDESLTKEQRQRQHSGAESPRQCRDLGLPHSKEKSKNNLDIDMTSFTRINSKWVTGLHVNHKTRSNPMKATKDELDFVKIKHFCEGLSKE